MSAMDHILIVDDDRDIRDLLSEYLQKQGYRVSVAADGRAMRTVLSRAEPDLIVLDLMLPGEDGLVLCREVRAQSDIPIIILTARGEEVDRIVGLEMGADDYLAKPFSPRELLARIKSILRRTRSLPSNLKPDQARLLHFAGWTLEVATRNLLSPEGIAMALSGTDYKLLRIFLDHPNRVLNRDQLIDMTQSRDAGPFDRSIDLQVSRLRRRLNDNPKEPAIIKTARGEGYVLAAEVSVES
ncbi:response regulator [Zwartia sp.]|uniref:response regulator n=1 Tax=Zwartia sp. TaxID=2978004 RepID=UPI00271EFDD1|nr:response regulator [Zwartia sp.]MDO9023503.1 response regulator [Zwartia sp.]